MNYGLLCHLCIKWSVTEGVLRTENTRVFSTLVFGGDAGRHSAFTVLQGTSLATLGAYLLKSISWERASVFLKKWELLRETFLILCTTNLGKAQSWRNRVRNAVKNVTLKFFVKIMCKTFCNDIHNNFNYVSFANYTLFKTIYKTPLIVQYFRRFCNGTSEYLSQRQTCSKFRNFKKKEEREKKAK